jgi:hypothetical protein
MIPAGSVLAAYLATASEEDRAQASESLHRLAWLIIRVHERRLREQRQSGIRACSDSTLDSNSPPPHV